MITITIITSMTSSYTRNLISKELNAGKLDMKILTLADRKTEVRRTDFGVSQMYFYSIMKELIGSGLMIRTGKCGSVSLYSITEKGRRLLRLLDKHEKLLDGFI